MRAISFIASLLALFSPPALAQTGELEKGLELFHKGDYSGARVALQQAIEDQGNQDDPRAAAFLALSEAAMGDCESALPVLTDVFERRGEDESGRLAGLAAAECHLSGKRFALAAALAYRLQQQFPENADVLYQLARFHLKAWDQAVLEIFEKTPASFRVNQLSAEIFEIQGRYGEAIGEYRKAIEKNPAALNLHFRLGRALLMHSHESENLSRAAAEFEAELKLNPSDAVAEYQLARVLEAQERPDEALPHLERAAALDAAFPEALIALGRARLRGERYGDAIALLEKAVTLADKSEAAHYSLMMAYRNAGRRDDALRSKERLDDLRAAPEGEFTEFLKRIGEAPAEQ